MSTEPKCDEEEDKEDSIEEVSKIEEHSNPEDKPLTLPMRAIITPSGDPTLMPKIHATNVEVPNIGLETAPANLTS